MRADRATCTADSLRSRARPAGNGGSRCSIGPATATFSTQRHISEDEAAATLLANLDGEAMAEPRTLRFVAGRRRKAGSAMSSRSGFRRGFIEPLESTSIHLIQTGDEPLARPASRREISQAARDDFNRKAALEMERIRDFIILHYHANGRRGEPFWDELREMEIPETLRRRIDLFRSTAVIAPSLDELFDTRGWSQVMIGQHIIPDRWHPVANQMPEPRLKEFLDGLEQAYVGEASTLPDHGAFVAKFGP